MTFISILLFFYASAASSKCTAWKQDTTVKFCTYNGASTRMWFRTCLNALDKEEICYTENPDSIKNDCTEWLQQREKCVMKQGGFGDRWTRACKTQNDKTELCLDSDPNTL